MQRTVTFLLTDVEGSTGLWERDPEAMSRAVARHDALLAEAVTRHRGIVVKSRGEGDSVFAVLDDAAAAVCAALDAQRAVASEAWPTQTPLRVRMGLHTGAAELRDGDFYGPVVNRCARLRGIARGGQVLVTDEVAAEVRGRLPPGAELHELGPLRLRGLADACVVFELRHPDLARLPAPAGVAAIEFRVLGPLEVVVAGEPVAIGKGKQRALLALLLLQVGKVVLAERLVEDLWPETQPEAGTSTLQVYVSRLRKALPEGALVTEAGGYRLAVEPESLDAHRFRRLVVEARTAREEGDPDWAVDLLEQALAVWHGPALADVAYEPFAQPEIGRLEELRIGAVEDLLDAQLARGRSGELVGELDALVAAHPLRERLHELRMLALYRAGRQADALAAYRTARDSLVEQLGIEPGPGLRELERRILAQDPALSVAAPPSPAVVTGPPAGAERQGHLPLQATSFVGRERDLVELRELLARERHVTIRGPGGAGKTRLALKVSEELTPEFGHGTWLVELGAAADGPRAWAALAMALDIAEEPGRELADTIPRILGDRRMLLVLDNCEHVLDAARAIADVLLSHCPGVRILATSRERLGDPAELVWPIPDMAADAAQLFVERGARVLAGHALAATARDVVERICRRLDGLPLAIELAAARLNVLSVEQIEERLTDRFRLLSRGTPSAPARHGSLRAMVDWSYELLTPPEQAGLAAASIFPSGFDIEAAEAVLSGDEEVLDVLASLVDKSLIARSEADGQARYRLHETIREYAAERRDASKETQALRRRHAQHFVTLARRAEPHLRRASRDWLDRLEREHDNLRAALDHLEASGETQLVLRVVGAIAEFWDERGHQIEGRRRIEAALRADERPTAARAKALLGGASLAISGGDAAAARVWADEALALYRELEDASGIAEAARELGAAVGNAGDLEQAKQLLDESLRRFGELGDEYSAIWAARYLAWALHGLGDYERERALHEDNLRRARRLGVTRAAASTLGALGDLAIDEGRLEDAVSLLEECHRLHHEHGDVVQVGLNLCRIARLLAMARRTADASRVLASYQATSEQIGGTVPWVAQMNRETRALIASHPEPTVPVSEARPVTPDEAVALARRSIAESASPASGASEPSP